MKTHHKSIVALVMLPFLFVACTQQPPPAPATPAATGPTPKAYGTMLDIMRTIPFPNSNVIFDTQSTDPEQRKAAAKAAAEKGTGDQYGGTYGGWEGVAESGVAIAEFSNLLLIPRKCSNGLDAPVDREDWKKYVQGLADAGVAAQKAAMTKNQDNMVDVSGTLTEACMACHQVYRDQPEPKQRCTP